MIYEFALEPELVAEWHDQKHGRFFAEKFGLKSGRIVSKYPKKWPQLVWQSFENGPAGGDQNARMRLEALLGRLSRNSVKRRSSFSEQRTWLEKAESEDKERPFHGIIVREHHHSNPKIIESVSLSESEHPLWKAQDSDHIVRRKASELASAVAPILRLCKHVIFVDPYFDPREKRFKNPFTEFMKQVWTHRYGVEVPQVELHTGTEWFIKNYFKKNGQSPAIEQEAQEKLRQAYRQHMPETIPSGRSIQVKFWKQRDLGEKLHNRYILTDFAGVIFGTGLDEAKKPENAETDDLSLMTERQLDFRWKQYTGSPFAFDPSGPAFDDSDAPGIIGTANF